MPLTATLSGLLGLPLKHLRAQVAASATFQTVTGSVDATEALEYVHVGDSDDTIESPPRAIIRYPDETSVGKVSRLGFDWTGSIMLTFEFPIAAGDVGNFEDAYATFLNDVGEVIREILASSETAGFLNISSIQIGPIGAAMTEENEGASFCVCHTIVNFKGMP